MVSSWDGILKKLNNIFILLYALLHARKNNFYKYEKETIIFCISSC